MLSKTWLPIKPCYSKIETHGFFLWLRIQEVYVLIRKKVFSKWKAAASMNTFSRLCIAALRGAGISQRDWFKTKQRLKTK